MPLLTAERITKSYTRSGQADTVVLRGVSATIDAGEFVAITGPSGAGKSTLLHILASLDEPDGGHVVLTTGTSRFAYDSMSSSALSAMRNRYVGVVFQFHHLLPEFSAIENVMMPALIAGTNAQTARTKATSLLDRVGMVHRATHAPSELSGGEQQRVAIARALMNDPLLLVADEPTGNLDSANATAVTDLLCELQESFGMTCLIATHSTDVAARAHRILHLKDGLFVDAGA